MREFIARFLLRLYYDEIKCMTHCLRCNHLFFFDDRFVAFDAMLILRWHLYVVMANEQNEQEEKLKRKNRRAQEHIARGTEQERQKELKL